MKTLTLTLQLKDNEDATAEAIRNAVSTLENVKVVGWAITSDEAPDAESHIEGVAEYEAAPVGTIVCDWLHKYEKVSKTHWKLAGSNSLYPTSNFLDRREVIKWGL